MAPKFSIVLCPEEPELDYLPNYDEHTWDFPPQSEYLGNLTPFQQDLYEQLRARNWTDEQSYFYFTNLDVNQGFAREFLRHKGWTQEQIQQWDEECQRTNPLPDSKGGLDFQQRKQAVVMDILKEASRRRDITEEMMQGIESQDDGKST